MLVTVNIGPKLLGGFGADAVLRAAVGVAGVLSMGSSSVAVCRRSTRPSNS